MKTLTNSLIALVLIFSCNSLQAQGEMKPVEGYSPTIGLMVYMLEDLKERITEEVKDLDQSQVDFLYDENANSIGALIMHLVSTESYYLTATVYERGWTEKEQVRLGMAGELNKKVNAMLTGEPISHYLALWDEVRNNTLAALKSKDDAWFASNLEEGLNYQYIWYHVMEHSANHMGQILTIKNRLPE